MDLRDVVSALRASWWVLASGAVLGALVAVGASLVATPLYTSQTQLFIASTSSETTADVFQGSQFSQQRVASYAQLLMGEELAGRVVEAANLDIAPSELAQRIQASAVPQTVLVDVTVTDPSARRAQVIAQTLGREFPRFVAELETSGSGSASPIRVTVTDRPDLASAPSEPKLLRNIIVGVAAGVAIGLLIALLRVRLDRAIKDPKEAAELGGAALIGTIIRDDLLGSRHVIDRTAPTRAAEDYRQLRTNLQFLNVDNPPKVIMVSSAMPAEGKTTAAINLALALAEAGRQVTLLDADLRRPRVTNYLGMVSGVGLTNILAGTADLADVLQTYGDTGVSVIGAGPTPPNPSELLASKHMLALIDELREKSEYVLIDAPPLLPVADSTGLAVMVDGVLLSVRYGKSRKDQLQEAAATLERVGARTLGLILNIVPPKAGITAAYGYGYTYAEDGSAGSKGHRS